LDALLGKAADRRVLPNLSQIVLVGFSAGGQLVQRYAVVGRGEGAFGRGGIDLRYVVGSPSSYLYFTEDRPRPEGGFGPFAEAAACPNFNPWKYGLAGDLPRYVQPALQDGAAALDIATSSATSSTSWAPGTMIRTTVSWTSPAPPRRKGRCALPGYNLFFSN
jgi:hypothetical protein